ncbi:type VI-B CRISPR-associated RNA-guided ribonuclease Cas13b [Bergeyella zoohelcum]|uniref:type VI-B CRISPR-associated RNA-guided ribonuclease Cas13b n=1 Tax=Bergeyella zoohelcum TaxID=1015 RepID=UPI003735BF8C
MYLTLKSQKKGFISIKRIEKKLWEKNKSIFNEKSLSNWEQNTQKDVEKFFRELGRVKDNDEKKNRIKEYLEKIQLWNEFKEDIDKNRFNSLKDNVVKKIPKLPQYFKSWQKFEKELRLIRNQDMLMWLMCKELHNQTMVEQLEIEKLFLKHLKVDVTDRAEKEAPTQSINVLNRVVAMKLPVTTYKTNDKGTVLKKEPLEIFYIEENQTKLLKQGNFKALVKDRRLNGLFSFIGVNGNCPKDHPITKKDLEHELGKYQTTRIEIFKSTLELEKRMLEKYPDLPADNFRQMLEEWQKKKSNGEDFNNIVKALVAVRNAFSHNQYPMYDEDLFGKKTYLLGTSKGNLDIAIKLQEETVKNVTLITNSL